MVRSTVARDLTIVALSKDKDEVEQQRLEVDLRATRLQSDLVSVKKALRQAVTQVQGLELEKEQHFQGKVDGVRGTRNAIYFGCGPALRSMAP